MHAMLNIAVRAARKAGALIVRQKDHVNQLNIISKARNEYASEVDNAAESIIIEIIKHAYPEHAIIAEESGVQGQHDFTWIIDPLDGTTNYLHGFPVYSVSIAIRYKDTLEHAVVYDPLRDELFTASRGRGAYLDNHRIRCTQLKSLEKALLGTGFPYRDKTVINTYLKLFEKLFMHTSGIRRTGSAAIDLCYVAAGRLDGFWEYSLKAWDIAGGALIIKEAGGIVTDMHGEDKFLENGHIVAGSFAIHKQLLKMINDVEDEIKTEASNNNDDEGSES